MLENEAAGGGGEDPLHSERSNGGATNVAIMVHFGLPDFESLGYAPTQTNQAHDRRLQKCLGLRRYIHRRTGVDRLCFAWEKKKIPADTTPEEIRGLAARLKQLDHVNVLRCFEVAEDSERLYFVHEYMVAKTLTMAMDSHEQQKWSPEQVANLARECCAAVHAAERLGLRHLNLCPQRVLLPTEEGGDIRVAKVYGFGLFGTLSETLADRIHWAPEARLACHAAVTMGKKSFCRAAMGQEQARWDAWSLGFVLYSAVEGRVPYTCSPDAILKSQDGFAYDLADLAARTTVDGLLTPSYTARATVAGTLKSEWFRRHWRYTTAEMEHVVRDLRAFCTEPLAKRLFGRFLVQFLDDRHLRAITRSYYVLDVDGDGVVSDADLQVLSKMVHLRHRALDEILHAMRSHRASDGLPFTSFADSLSERTIDGRALRLSFESIDEDGSEQITPAELHDTLRALDPALTMRQVIGHIDAVEAEAAASEDDAGTGGAGGHAGHVGTSQDHALDYLEYCSLFPMRIERLKALEKRTMEARSLAEEMRARFHSVEDGVKEFVERLETVQQEIHDKKGAALDHLHGDRHRIEAVKTLRDSLQLAESSLQHAPGPHQHLDVLTHDRAKARRDVSLAKPSRRKKEGEYELVLGFDDFLQEKVADQDWIKLLHNELKLMTQATGKRERHRLTDADYLSVYQHAGIAECKLKRAMEWTRAQADEYEAFVEALRGEESLLPSIPLSSRGLQKRNDTESSGLMAGVDVAVAAAVALVGMGGIGTHRAWDSELNPFRRLCGQRGLELPHAPGLVSREG